MKHTHILLAALSLAFAAKGNAQQNPSQSQNASVQNNPIASEEASNAVDSEKEDSESVEKATDSTEKKADMTVTVLATRISESSLSTVGTTSSVNIDQMETTGATSLKDGFKYMPGVSVPYYVGGGGVTTPYLDGGDKGVNIRGIDGNRVSMLIDGIRQPEDFSAHAPAGGGTGRVYFDPAVFEQMDVYKSAASTLYGNDALGGVFGAQTIGPRNLLPSDLKGYAAKDSVMYATADRSINNLLQAAAGDGKWAGSVAYSFRDGSERENNADIDPNPVDFTTNAVVAKVLRQSELWEVEGAFDYYILDRNTHVKSSEGPYMTGMPGYVNNRVIQDDQRDRTRVSLRGSASPTDLALFDTLDVLGYWQESRVKVNSKQWGTTGMSLPGVPRNQFNELSYDTQIWGTDLQAEKFIDGSMVSQTLLYGTDFSFSKVKNSFDRTIVRPASGTTSYEDRIGMAPSDVYRFGVFVTDAIDLGTDKQWALTPGLRVDYYNIAPNNPSDYVNRNKGQEADSYTNWSVAPSLSLMYRITENMNVYGTYSHGVRNPSAEELSGIFSHNTDFLILPNPDLEEEKSDSFEIGYQLNVEHHAFQVSTYYNRYKDFIETMVLVDGSVTPKEYTAMNRDKVEIYGVELRWDWLIQEQLVGFKGGECGASVAWTEGTTMDVENPVTGSSYDTPLDSVDPWKLVTYIGYTDPEQRWGTRLSATFVGDKSKNDISESVDTATGEKYHPYDSMDGFVVLDLTGFVRIDEHWEINFGLNNITDEEYSYWASGGHSGGGHGSKAGLYTEPGINGFIGITASF